MIKVTVDGKEQILSITNIAALKSRPIDIKIIPNAQYAVVTDAPIAESKIQSHIYYTDTVSGLNYFFFTGKCQAYKHGSPLVDEFLDYSYTYFVDKDVIFPLSPKIITLLSASTDRKDFYLPRLDVNILKSSTLSSAVDERKVSNKILEAYDKHITFFDERIFIFPSALSSAPVVIASSEPDTPPSPVWHELTEEVADKLVHHFEPNASSNERNEVVKFLYLELSKAPSTHIYNPEWVLFSNNIIYDTNPHSKKRTFPYDPTKHFFTRMVPYPYLSDDKLSTLKPSTSLNVLIDALSRRQSNPESRRSRMVANDMLIYTGMLLTDKKYDIALFLTGTGGNGKSQYIKFITKLIPSSQVVNANTLINESSFPTLASKRLLILEEINKLDRMQEGQVIDTYKTISGQDVLSYRKFYTHSVINIVHKVQFVITANTVVPGFYAEESTIRRFKVVNSEVKVKDISKDRGDYVGESVTDVAASLETDVNLTWYANYAVRALVEAYTPSSKARAHTLIPRHPVEKMFEPDTAVFLANKHHLTNKLLRGLRNQKIIPNMYDFNILNYVVDPKSTQWTAAYMKKFISTILKYSPEKLFEMYSGVGLTSDAFPDSDTINRTLSIIFERVLTPRNGFALLGNSLYDDDAKIIIKEPTIQKLYDEARGILETPGDLTFEVLYDFTAILKATTDKRWKLIDKRKNDIVRASKYHTKENFDILLNRFSEIYEEFSAEISSGLENFNDYPEEIDEYAPDTSESESTSKSAAKSPSKSPSKSATPTTLKLKKGGK